jgi:hypothetical protein
VHLIGLCRILQLAMSSEQCDQFLGELLTFWKKDLKLTFVNKDQSFGTSFVKFSIYFQKFCVGQSVFKNGSILNSFWKIFVAFQSISKRRDHFAVSKHSVHFK